ncbi:hypothetical protein A10D4_10251 [Idiomarina xiamenensis 10-D-4]|uniref:Lipoprotein n=2 Tax=Idiomarina xiamenensis TaxID=1207041 RepID=K2JDI5_9GAMM|nr:hypothetical protein A10D4_10251 [Idiomarina xiamenensis 10-D-4]
MFALPRRYVGILCIGLSAMLLSACQPKNTPQDHFMTQLAKHCGKAYVGQVVSDNLQDTAWASSRIIMHVRNCSAQQIEIPLHVGDDRSRTWVITRLDDQLSLQHVHVHEDGSPDESNRR